ncbi:SAM-dependent methyltransferase [Schizosaccharomyces cryophilus OY26]|uniref:SAM-dependent methyltransferase n=1 Tax=Schizosaccharomyces cryophilus (strain OY26 / ATCC MYA-4695 / CBS 11777 / NBRC 106824 / NRRL Y48691) TaxID=653667 RepID=S9XAY1_SCHCR|nr:SAM-dependent methyltransferase [Schizosaccharomyces cryophilus OY26]EPY50891.1 SAM-dependent methyltransferase [Schizosaccharomyces cryophilus OY26]
MNIFQRTAFLDSWKKYLVGSTKWQFCATTLNEKCFYSTKQRIGKKKTLYSFRASLENEYFKFLESIQEKEKMFAPGQLVINLGSSPGIWNNVASQHIGSEGRVVSVDIIPSRSPANCSTIQGNFLSMAIQDEVVKAGLRARKLQEASAQYGDPSSVPYLQLAIEHEAAMENQESLLKELRADVVISDLNRPFPMVQGFEFCISKTPYLAMRNRELLTVKDHMNSLFLAQSALIFSLRGLKPSGTFLCKVVDGPNLPSLLEDLTMSFSKVTKHNMKGVFEKENSVVYLCSGKISTPPIELLNV